MLDGRSGHILTEVHPPRAGPLLQQTEKGRPQAGPDAAPPPAWGTLVGACTNGSRDGGGRGPPLPGEEHQPWSPAGRGLAPRGAARVTTGTAAGATIASQGACPAGTSEGQRPLFLIGDSVH